jgi:hypothetical protein
MSEKYKISVNVLVSYGTEFTVEADSPEAAIEPVKNELGADRRSQCIRRR